MTHDASTVHRVKTVYSSPVAPSFGNAACGSVWYQNATEAMSSVSVRYVLFWRHPRAWIVMRRSWSKRTGPLLTATEIKRKTRFSWHTADDGQGMRSHDINYVSRQNLRK